MESQSRPRIDNRWPTRFAPLPIDAPRPAGTAVNDPESDRSRQTPRQAKLRSDVRRAIVQPCAEPAASPGRKPCRIYGRPTPPATNRPLLSQASRALTCQTDAVNRRSETVPSAIAGDDPLTIYVDKREIVTLMPLGGAPEALASAGAEPAVAHTFAQAHPVFCLCRRMLLPQLTADLDGGSRKIDLWYSTLQVV